MESSESASSFLRNRRLESFFDSSSPDEKSHQEEATPFNSQSKEQRSLQSDVEGGEDSWSSVVISWVRIVLCFVTMMVTTVLWCIIMVVLIPWPQERIRQGNVYGHVTGWLLVWILGNPIKIEGTEFTNERAIYISNHASPLDTFLLMWLIPTGTVGIAKKEIIWYPMFGQIYVLASHLRIDRSNRLLAIESMKEAARTLINNNLSVIIFPEGTRSITGRLLPFKMILQGFVHLALQTKLLIVPIVLTGTHLAWKKNSLRVRPTPLIVKFLPPISTDDWKNEKINEYVTMVHDVFAKNLPESQRPLRKEDSDSTSVLNHS